MGPDDPKSGDGRISAMSTLRIELNQRVNRPADVVRAQAMDMAHHIEKNVHQDLKYTILNESSDRCRVRVFTRLLGLPQVDVLDLQAHPDGTVSQTYIEGANQGLKLTFHFHAVAAGATLIQVIAEAPVRGWKRLLRPILRSALKKIGMKALEEDRRDLEEGRYQPRAARAKAA
jgi:hypothetical protein